MSERKAITIATGVLHPLGVIAGAGGLTLAFFLVLPLMQAIRQSPDANLIVQGIDVAHVPPPPPPEEEPETEPEEEEQPPELLEDAPPLELSQLELALNAGLNDGWLGGDFAVKLNTVTSAAREVDALFNVADLDQQPRVIYQPAPVMTPKIRSKAPGKVYIIFIVDERGRVTNPILQRSTDPVFERSAMDAVKQWKFEPGKRNGEAVRFRMRVPITFPAG